MLKQILCTIPSSQAMLCIVDTHTFLSDRQEDMNVVSGCPRFVSHHDLKNSGFIVDDTIFIKCVIDRNAV